MGFRIIFLNAYRLRQPVARLFHSQSAIQRHPMMSTKEPLPPRIEPLNSGALFTSVDRLRCSARLAERACFDTNVTWEKGWSADATTSILIDYVYVTRHAALPIIQKMQLSYRSEIGETQSNE